MIRTTKALLSVYYAYMMEYRAELLLWALSGSMPFILLGVWTEAARTGGSAISQFGLSQLDFARYFLSVFIVRQFTVVWVVWDFEREVLEGKLSSRLLQPIDPVWRHVAAHVSERFARFPFAVGLVVLFFCLYPQAWWIPNGLNFLTFLMVIVATFALRFLMQYTFALLSFWTERASAIEEFWLLLYLFLSGLVAPLQVFPAEVREVIMWTPFPYLVHFPASLLVGLPVDLGRGVLVMAGWATIFLIINRWLWYAGMKKYSGMGA